MVIQEVWYANIAFFLGQGNVTTSEIILKFKHFYTKKGNIYLNKKCIIIII